MSEALLNRLYKKLYKGLTDYYGNNKTPNESVALNNESIQHAGSDLEWRNWVERKYVEEVGSLPDWFTRGKEEFGKDRGKDGSGDEKAYTGPDPDRDVDGRSDERPTETTYRQQDDATDTTVERLSNTRLSTTASGYIERMIKGESLLRIGPIWYGTDRYVTVPNVSYFANKQVDVIPVLRAEAASAFTSSRPPVDTVQVEIIVHYSRFRTHIQRLFALSQVMPVVPVMNALITSVVQPLDGNRRIYTAYGHKGATDIDVTHSDTTEMEASKLRKYLLSLYSSVPVQMKIDNIVLESIKGASRDVRLLVRLTRVLTANSYGDRVMYVRSLKGARDQYNYMEKLSLPDMDEEQARSIADVLGVDHRGMDHMIDALRRSAQKFEGNKWHNATTVNVLAGDTLEIKREGTDVPIYIKLAGVIAPECEAKVIGHTKNEPFGFASRNRLLKLVGIGRDIQVLKKGVDKSGGREYQVCMVRYQDRGHQDPAVIMLREGLLIYTAHNLSATEGNAYSSAYTTAKKAERNIHGSAYFKRIKR